MRPLDQSTAAPILEALPYGLVMVAPDQVILDANSTARNLLPRVAGAPLRCYELLGCARPGQPCEKSCMALQAADSGEVLAEARVDVQDLAQPTALWVTAAPLLHEPGAVLHLRPGAARDRRRRSQPGWPTAPGLRIRAFGRMTIESGPSSLDGQWVGERPGQVLQYLLCQPGRAASADAIAESIWPDRGPEALNSTRHAIHRLRAILEPDRAPRGASSFLTAIPGGYALDAKNVWIDVAEFEQAIGDGMGAVRALEFEAASDHFARAADLYVGEFLADAPYADWAFDERNRLHGLAVGALRTSIVVAHERDDPVAALDYLERLCAIEPYDERAYRELIVTLYAAGRFGDVKRHYSAFERRLRREFDKAPGFDLKSLAARRPASQEA